MSDIEGAVNPADVSPADSEQELSDVYGEEEFIDEDAEGGAASALPAHLATKAPATRHWRDGSAPPVDTNASEVGSQDDDDTQQPENAGEGGEAGEEGTEGTRSAFIPRDRFDQVHGRAQQLEQETATLKERETVITRAMAAGYRDLAAFEHDDKWAKANNYENIERYLEEREQSRQFEEQKAKIKREADQEVLKGNITPEFAADLIKDKEERLQERIQAQRERQMTRRELAEVRGLVESAQKSTLDQTIAAARTQFGHVDDDQWKQIEALCRDIGHPDAVQRVIATFAPATKGAAKKAAEAAVIDHNKRRQANGSGAPAPEGRGGGQAAPQLPKATPQQAKSRLLSELLGFRR